MNQYIRYRIGVINDFRNSYGYIDYQQWTPEVKQWSCFKTENERVPQQSDDAIHVFLNFKKVGLFKETKAAKECIAKLLDDAPASMMEFRSYILEV